MRCKIIRANDGHLINIRHTDEIAEEYNLNGLDADTMEYQLKNFGRFWLDAETLVKPVH